VEWIGKLGFFVGIGVSLWFLWYGVTAGILQRRMLRNRYSERYITGPAALRRGLFFAVIGLTGLVIAGLTMLRVLAARP
jgi:hypothetical protein